MKTFLLAAAVTAAMAGAANANTIKLADSYGGGQGGEFKATFFEGMPIPASGLNVLDTRTPVSLFQTFCVESNEYLNFTDTFNWDLNTAAVAGGSGGPSPDPLDFKTAYLYTQFYSGVLSNYDFGNGGLREDDGTALQRVIWYLESEIGADDGTQATADTFFGGAGTQEALWYKEATQANWTDIGNVRVLNLWHFGSPRHEDQDVLVMVPTPRAALAGMSLLAGIGVVGYIRRRGRTEFS